MSSSPVTFTNFHLLYATKRHRCIGLRVGTKDDDESTTGRQIYENFKTVVQLKEQHCVTDPEWNDLLQHIRFGKCRARHLNFLRKLIVTNPDCPPTDFDEHPWTDAILITPRHGVLRHWNAAAVRQECARKKVQLLRCLAEDTTAGRPLTLQERFLAVRSQSRPQKSRREKAGLSNMVELFIGMKMMITYNVMTDMDLANGARGEIVDIVLDEREDPLDVQTPIINLKYPPQLVLVKLLDGKAMKLHGLPDGVLPITPISKSFTFQTSPKSRKNANRRQLPIVPAYALTDYRGQGQTVVPVFIDIGRPPTGHLTAFNAYVALLRARGQHTVRLLRDFDDKIFTQHPCEYLRNEDIRLEKLDRLTKEWWNTLRSN
jgi:hypothetical protein